MPVRRLQGNPLITPEDLKPSRNGFEVFGVFNCGAVKVGGEYLLLARVAERPEPETDWIGIPTLNAECDGPEILRIRRDQPGIDASDPRMVTLADGRVLLTSISHLRIARSRDGHSFTVDERPALLPTTPQEGYGIEDPRTTFLEGRHWITYCAVSEMGVTTALASTGDWQTFERHGIIFGPGVKDACLFPEKIGGRYVCRYRPWSRGIGRPAIWTACSPDLMHWGGHRQTLTPRKKFWDEERVGAGAPPLRTERGWLEIYHGADLKGRYCLGAMLSALDEPSRVIARCENPILEPQADYETHGVYAPCVASCGMIAEEDGSIKIYYGAADTVVACAETSVAELLDLLY